MTHGDSSGGCKCPHCKKVNHGLLRGRSVPQGSIAEFEQPCEHCQKPIYCWARWLIVLDAEKPEKVK